MSTFAARFAGRCANDCEEPIEVGDDVLFIEGELMHAVCVALVPGGAASAPCPSCWLVGRCDC